MGSPFRGRRPFRDARALGKAFRVTVLGAGVAGLAAAVQLDWDGCDVTVVEAREEPGGRIRTLRDVPRAGALFELGAARIASNHTYTHECIDWLGLTLEPFYPARGTLVTETNGRVLRQALSGTGRGNAEHIAITEGTGLRTRGLIGAWRERLWGPQWTSIRGGADQLPRGMAESLGARVRYGAAVRALEQDARSVRIECAAPGTGAPLILTADRVVCTLPFTVLRDLDVRPAFTPDKRRVIDGLWYESALRIAMAMEPGWEPGEWCGFGSSDRMGELWTSPARGAAGGRTLIWYALGDRARALAALSETQRQAEARAALDRLVPGLGARVREGTSFVWDQDPWARGAQSHVWDYGIQHSPLIRRPEGRIHFAGEHTAARRRLGWIDGALESGLRAAREVQEAG